MWGWHIWEGTWGRHIGEGMQGRHTVKYTGREHGRATPILFLHTHTRTHTHAARHDLPTHCCGCAVCVQRRWAWLQRCKTC